MRVRYSSGHEDRDSTAHLRQRIAPPIGRPVTMLRTVVSRGAILPSSLAAIQRLLDKGRV